MNLCIVRFNSGEEKTYRLNFKGLKENEEVVVEVIENNLFDLSRAKFIRYVDIADTPNDELMSVVGRWIGS